MQPELVLEQVQKMGWSVGSNRALVLIGDDVPHTAGISEMQMKTYNIPNPRPVCFLFDF
jgi:hypothetical protein